MNGSGRRNTRHSRPGFINEETFMRTVEYLRRNVGVDRVNLKTGAYRLVSWPWVLPISRRYA